MTSISERDQAVSDDRCVNQDDDAMDLRERARKLFEEAAQLGINDDDLQKALGLTENYFKRLSSEVMSHRRNSGKSTRTINEKILTALEGICQVARGRKGMHSESLEEYIDRVTREFESLGDGDAHTLISIPPPLESERKLHLVRKSVIEAAHRGTKFTYAFPCPKTVTEIFEVFGIGEGASHDKIDEEWRERAKTFRDVFSWIRNIESNFENDVMRQLGIDAINLDLDFGINPHTEGSYTKSLQENVDFRTIGWLPMSFNEKVIWIKHRSKDTTIRKEMFHVSRANSNEPIYSDKHQWKWHDYPMSEDALQAILAVAEKATKQKFEKKWSDIIEELCPRSEGEEATLSTEGVA